MKRILKRISIVLLAAILVCLALAYYLLSYRFKESLRYAVRKQTKGLYAFDAGEAEVLFGKRAIRLRNSSVRCVDARAVSSAYEVQIPDLYVSLASLKDLLLNRKMIIDSLALTAPVVKVNAGSKRAAVDRPRFKGTDILDILQKTLEHFNAHSFNIRHAVYDYSIAGTAVLRVNDINLYVLNFTGINNADDHLFGSERVVFSLGRQHWVLPKHRQQVRFSALRFDSRGQRLEVDSVAYAGADTAGSLAFTADQLFFNSRHLPALYQHNHLLIDTLTCLNPVLTVPGGRSKSGRRRDTLLAADQLPFDVMKIGVINVLNADVHLQGRQAASRNSNLGIYNLQVHPGTARPLTFDSVRLDLKALVFYSRDSLYQMRIGEFATEKDGILFKGVTYTPTAKNNGAKIVTATAPALRLKHVDLESLLRKHLRAEEAELVQPVITVRSKQGKAAKKQRLQGKNLGVFYQTLHGISDMVHVDHFRLRDGALSYRSAGEQGTRLEVEGIHAHILPHQLFLSDSLVDIKHAIPELRAANVQLHTKGNTVTARNYRLDGVTRRNRGDSIVLSLHNGLRVRIKDVFWEALDWDVYHKTGDIQVDLLTAGHVDVHLPEEARGKKHASKPLPVVRIGKIQVGGFSIAKGENVAVNGGTLALLQLQTKHHYFAWRDALVKLRSVRIRKPGMRVSAGPAAIYSGRESTVQDIQFEHGGTKVALPELKLMLPLQSTEFSNLSLPYVEASGASVQIDTRTHKTAPAKPFEGLKLPLQLKLGVLRLNNGDMTYTGIGVKDTMRLHARVNVKVADVGTTATGLTFHTAALTLSETNAAKAALTVQLPHASLTLQHGEVDHAGIAANAALSWNGASVRTASFSAAQLAGSLPHTAVHWRPGEAFNWQTAAALLTVRGGKLHFANNKLSAGAGGLHWAGGALRLNGVFLQPALSRDETFRTEKWQQDYITLNGGNITIAGLDVARMADTPLVVPKVLLDGMALEVSRDKRLPFQHGVYKYMPTQLIRQVKFPFRADTIAIANSTVTYAERTTKADRWNEIPLTQLQGVILGLRSYSDGRDSLLVKASANVFNAAVQQLSYREAYADSLSGFSASLSVSPLSLPELGSRMMPHGNVQIRRGAVDTIYSSWEGNNYAAWGSMQFYYNGLQLRIGGRRRLLPMLETWLVNLLVPSRISKPSLIFSPRDHERFIFNYWINVQKSGVMSAVGLKRNRKYRKQYRKYQQQYRLPPSAPGFER